MFGVVGIFFQLFTELCYKYAQVLRFGLVAHPPNFLQDELVGKCTSVIDGQQSKQAKLRCGKLYSFALPFDNTGRKVKSVGSTLRRAGERALAEEVTLLLRETWRADLEACEGVYVACARAMRPLLFGKNDVPACVDARDPRVQKIPFGLAKPTLAHVVAAYERLTTVFFHAPAPADPPPPPAEKAEEEAAAAAEAEAKARAEKGWIRGWLSKSK